MLKDFQFAFRQLLKQPGFSAIAILTLALGIGSDHASFFSCVFFARLARDARRSSSSVT